MVFNLHLNFCLNTLNLLQYYIENRDKKREYQKQYYLKKKENKTI
jgi:hypothetical protein